jgi:Tfp pilus assembly protein PilO
MMSGRDKRALTIAGIAAAIFLLLAYGAFPVWDAWQAERGGLPVREQTLRKFREAVESRPLREAENATLEARLREAEAGLLTGDTPAIAGAELREWIQQLAADSSMEIVSSQFLPARPLGNDYWQVPLGVQLKGRFDSLLNFLKACGSGAKTLSVARLQIQRVGDAQKSVQVNLTVAGILPRTASEPPEGASSERTR